MRGGLFATLLIAAGLLTNWPAQADEPKFTNLMGRVPTSSEIVEGLIMPLGLRLEPVAPIRENETADVTSAPEAAPRTCWQPGDGCVSPGYSPRICHRF